MFGDLITTIGICAGMFLGPEFQAPDTWIPNDPHAPECTLTLRECYSGRLQSEDGTAYEITECGDDGYGNWWIRYREVGQ